MAFSQIRANIPKTCVKYNLDLVDKIDISCCPNIEVPSKCARNGERNICECNIFESVVFSLKHVTYVCCVHIIFY